MKILVTGTTRGLGLAIAERLAKNHEVTGCSRGSIQTTFNHVSGIDLRKPSTFQKLNLGAFDALVNNAGIPSEGLLATQAEEQISEVIDVNLKATLLLTKIFVRERLAVRCSGIIVNISSIIAIRGYAGLAAYAASKAGLDGATRALARELGPKGFRVNSVLPGYMETEMSASLEVEQVQQIIRRTPLGRLTTVSEVAAVVNFLVSDEAKSITGQSFIVDGGITV